VRLSQSASRSIHCVLLEKLKLSVTHRKVNTAKNDKNIISNYYNILKKKNHENDYAELNVCSRVLHKCYVVQESLGHL
jgi:hypothetical protein